MYIADTCYWRASLTSFIMRVDYVGRAVSESYWLLQNCSVVLFSFTWWQHLYDVLHLLMNISNPTEADL